MEQDQLRVKSDELRVNLVAEEGASLSSGSLRLYAKAVVSGQCVGEGEITIVGAVDLYSYDPVNRRAAVGIMVAN